MVQLLRGKEDLVDAWDLVWVGLLVLVELKASLKEEGVKASRVLLLATLAALMVGMTALAGTAWATGGTGPGGFGGAPTVVRTVPADGATDVALNANIKAKFSEAMKARSINTSTFYLLAGHFTYEDINGGCTGGPGPLAAVCPPAPVAATVRYNDDTKTAILDPTASLAPNTEYTVVVEGTGDGDLKAVKDRGGTPIATDFISYFTTGNTGTGLP